MIEVSGYHFLSFLHLIFHLSFMVFSALVVATSGAGYVLGSGNIVDIAGLCFTCTGTMMVAASANTLNQVHGSYFWHAKLMLIVFTSREILFSRDLALNLNINMLNAPSHV